MAQSGETQSGTHGSSTVTDGVRVTVRPKYLPGHSDPSRDRFIFNYHVTIANESDETVKLRSRKWNITDGEGNHHEVSGQGVVGQFPKLAPGETFEYSSFCPLQTSWGTMEGGYLMERADGTTFETSVGRFFLVGPTEAVRISQSHER